MNTRLEQIYQNNIRLLEKAGVQWEQWTHEPILDFETDMRIAAEMGWTATPTKSLFLRLKDGRYCIYLTEKDNRLATQAIRQLLGSRPSVCNSKVMEDVLGCIPGAVCPFGHDPSIELVVDRNLLTHDSLHWTPGLPEYTFAIAGHTLELLLREQETPVHWL
ncbi:YbaK/EbsC family protein [Endozoicomonadaceae bacterium StTr2]